MHDQKREIINHNKVTVDLPYSWLSMHILGLSLKGPRGAITVNNFCIWKIIIRSSLAVLKCVTYLLLFG